MACKECGAGIMHGGTPTGKTEKVHGLDTYIAEPPNGKQPTGFIVHIPDAFGWDFVNNRLLCDRYAERTGFRVYLPEFMNGHALSSSQLDTLDKMTEPAPWTKMIGKMFVPGIQMVTHFAVFSYFNSASVVIPRIFGFFKDLREAEAKDLPLFAAGFCWGGKYVTLLSHDKEKASNGRSLIDAGFTAHPSLLTIPGDIDPIQLPMSVAVGTKDIVLELAQAKKVQQMLKDKDNQKHEFVLMEGAKHGFAVRGNPHDKKELEQAKEAEDQAVNWFLKHSAKSS